jgi:hypothetical protein
MAQTYIKNATEVGSFSIDWETLLGVDTISTSVWACEAGITEDSESETATVATIVLSGGTAGTTYTCTNTIVTAAAATYVDTLYIIVPSDVMYNLFRDLRDDKGLGEATDDGQLFRKLQQAVKGAETYCGRKFIPVTATTRYYESDDVGGQYLYLDDDLISIDLNGLVNGDSSSTVIPATEYWLWPRNDGPPYWAIRLEANSTYSWECDIDYMIAVTGSWGWGTTIPDDVQRALIRWASWLYHLKDSPVYETTIFPESGAMVIPRGLPQDIVDALAPYKKIV